MNEIYICINDGCKLKKHCARFKENAKKIDWVKWNGTFLFEPDSEHHCRFYFNENITVMEANKIKDISC